MSQTWRDILAVVIGPLACAGYVFVVLRLTRPKTTKPAPPKKCRVADYDCVTWPASNCPRGCCAVHCACFCRGDHQ